METTRSLEAPGGPSRLILPAALLVLCALGLGAWFALRTTPGPLALAGGPGNGVSAPGNVGARFSVGVDTATNGSSEPVLIDSVVPDDVPSGLQILGYKVWASPVGGVGIVRSYPPTGDHGWMLKPVAGWQVLPHQSLQIIVGLKILRTGHFKIRGFTIHYHQGWHHYAAHYWQGVGVCAPLATTFNHCNP